MVKATKSSWLGQEALSRRLSSETIIYFRSSPDSRRTRRAEFDQGRELLPEAAQDARLGEVHRVDANAEVGRNVGRRLAVHERAPECIPCVGLELATYQFDCAAAKCLLLVRLVGLRVREGIIRFLSAEFGQPL